MYDKLKEKLPKWANAKKVLPKELYYELVQYACGMNVTIPLPNIEIKGPLSDFIWGLHHEGYQAKVIAKVIAKIIAKIVGKCRQQVNQIRNKRYERPKEMRVDTPIDIWRKQFLDGYYKDYIACK
jgi:hypothetical protein